MDSNTVFIILRHEEPHKKLSKVKTQTIDTQSCHPEERRTTQETPQSRITNLCQTPRAILLPKPRDQDDKLGEKFSQNKKSETLNRFQRFKIPLVFQKKVTKFTSFSLQKLPAKNKTIRV